MFEKYLPVSRIVVGGFVVLFIMQLIAVYMNAVSVRDRNAIRAQQQEFEKSQKQNRVMLDARARIQITLINTGSRRNAFTEEELNLIRGEWKNAEYDKVQAEPNLPERYDAHLIENGR